MVAPEDFDSEKQILAVAKDFRKRYAYLLDRAVMNEAEDAVRTRFILLLDAMELDVEDKIRHCVRQAVGQATDQLKALLRKAHSSIELEWGCCDEGPCEFRRASEE